MIIKWSFNKQESIEVDVPDEQVGELLALNKEFQRNDENAARKARRHKEVSIEEKFENSNEHGEQYCWEPIDESANPQILLERLETSRQVRKAIASLSVDKQELIHAVYYEGISVTQFAQRKGVSYQAKYKQLVKTKDELKKMLSKGVE